jgi:hypothetical protein
MKVLFFLILCIVLCAKTIAQYDTSKYMLMWTGEDSILVPKPDKADKYFEEGKYYLAIIEYKKKLLNEVSVGTLQRLAESYVMLNSKDSAFYFLYRASVLDSTGSILNDGDLYPLIADKRWQSLSTKLLKQIELKKGARYKNLSGTLKLLEMKIKDQAYYTQIETVEKTYRKTKNSVDSTILMELRNYKNTLNKSNLMELEKLIRKYGWPKKSIFGISASSAAFLIIQHSNIEVQKKYLPVLEGACKINEAEWQDYALMKDRILISEGKLQIYGSQVKFNQENGQYELYPIEDERNVDERRKKVGLTPLKFYLLEFGIDYQK